MLDKIKKLDAKNNQKKKKNYIDGYEKDQSGGTIELKSLKNHRRKTDDYSPAERSLDTKQN